MSKKVRGLKMIKLADVLMNVTFPSCPGGRVEIAINPVKFQSMIHSASDKICSKILKKNE